MFVYLTFVFFVLCIYTYFKHKIAKLCNIIYQKCKVYLCIKYQAVFMLCYNYNTVSCGRYIYSWSHTGNARAASICSQVLLLLAYIVCLLVSVRVCANDCINNIMINRNASCYVSIIYAKKWLLRVFFAACLRV